MAEEKDFEAIKYGYDREHELELNKFTHNLEVEQLKLLILLNGGAATALLAFADGPVAANAVAWLLLPVLLWLIGLVVAAWATLTMREAQSAFSKFYRHRRNATEWRLLADAFRQRGVALPLGISDDEEERLVRLANRGDSDVARALQEPDGALIHERLAKLTIGDARQASQRVLPLSVISLAFFLAGALCAAGVMAFAS